MSHPVSGACEGETCSVCRSFGDLVPARHKVGEEILPGDPNPGRHNLTAYLCCDCFRRLFGPVVSCAREE